MLKKLDGKRILIVEDDVINMAVYCAVLKRSGAIVIQDFFYSDTIRKLKQFLPVDVILLDLMLKHGMSGYDIIDAIRSCPELSRIPVVAVSAADPDTEIPKTKERGFSGFIAKPLDPVLFLDQLVACIEGKQVWYAPQSTMEEVI